MYAIVRTGGKQYRVERGQRLLIERLAANAGAEVSLETLLYRSDEAVLDKAGLQQVKVTAKVIEHVRGEKLRVFKFKPKRGYKRRTGHRQELTRIEVTEIASQKRKPARAREDAAATGAAEAGAAPGKDAAAKATARAPARAKTKAKQTQAGKPAAKPARAAKGAERRGKPAAKPARAAKGDAGAGKPAAKRAGTGKGAAGASPARKKPARAPKPRKDSDGS
jgi:large subunit ribosomal protein L21